MRKFIVASDMRDEVSVGRSRFIPDKLEEMLMTTRMLVATAALIAAASPARAQPTDEAAFRAIYKELIETNTTLSAGNCTLAAERMAA